MTSALLEGVPAMTRDCARRVLRCQRCSITRLHVSGEAAVRLPGCAHDTTVWLLAAQRDPGNVRLLDLDTLTDASERGAGSGLGRSSVRTDC